MLASPHVAVQDPVERVEITHNARDLGPAEHRLVPLRPGSPSADRLQRHSPGTGTRRPGNRRGSLPGFRPVAGTATAGVGAAGPSDQVATRPHMPMTAPQGEDRNVPSPTNTTPDGQATVTRSLPASPVQARRTAPRHVNRSCDPAPVKAVTCPGRAFAGPGDAVGPSLARAYPLGAGPSPSPRLAKCPKTP